MLADLCRHASLVKRTVLYKSWAKFMLAASAGMSIVAAWLMFASASNGMLTELTSDAGSSKMGLDALATCAGMSPTAVSVSSEVSGMKSGFKSSVKPSFT